MNCCITLILIKYSFDVPENQSIDNRLSNANFMLPTQEMFLVVHRLTSKYISCLINDRFEFFNVMFSTKSSYYGYRTFEQVSFGGAFTRLRFLDRSNSRRMD